MSARDAAEWDAAVLGRASATPFHAWTFLSTYAATAGLTFEPTLVRRDGVVIGGLPSLVRRRGALRWVNVGLAFAYAGPAVEEAYLDEVLVAVGRRHRLVTMHERFGMHVPPGESPPAGWRTGGGQSMVVRLAGRTEAELRAGATKKFRQHLGHAERGGVAIESATPADLDALASWVAQRFTEQGLPSLWTRDVIRAVCDDADARGSLRADAARVDGETLGVQLSLGLGTTVFPWLIGSEAGHDHLRIPTALSWHLLVQAAEAGYLEVDLSGSPTEGIAAFKRSMGARPQSHLALARGHSA